MLPTSAGAAALLGHGVSAPLVQRLLASDRLRPRLLAVIEHRLDPLPQPTAAQARILAMDPAALAELCRQAGAVWQHAAIAALIDGASVRALDALIGETLRRLALRSPAWNRPAPAAAAPSIIAGAAAASIIAGAIAPLGAACFADWCAGQPASVAARLALLLPADAQPAPEPGGAAAIAWLLDQP